MDPKQLTGLNLTDQELDEATRRLAFFAPTGAKEYVQELYEFLAIESLATLELGNWPGISIYKQLHNIIGIRIEYEELIAALDRLIRIEKVKCTTERAFFKDACFFLEPDQRNELLQQSEQQAKKEKKVIEQWKNDVLELYSALSSSDFDDLEQDLREYVYRLVSYNSAESVLLYYSGESTMDNIIEKLTTESIDQILPSRSEKLNKIRAEVLPYFFRTSDQERKSFIDGLLQSTFILHMIQLDPTCSALVKAEIKGGTIYLDTNFIFRLLGIHSPEMSFAAQSLVELSRKLNYSLFITPTTLTEYQHALRDHLSEFEKAPQLPSELLKMVIEASRDDEDPVISYYRKMAEASEASTVKRSFISSKVYYEYYAEIQAILEPLEITVNDQYCAEIQKDKKGLDEETGRLKSFIDDKRFNASQDGFFKELDPHVAEHDAFHRLLILRLRAGNEGSGFFDVPYWFLTCDTKLPVYDRIRRMSERLSVPFCVLSSQWLQTLRPFEPRLRSNVLVDSLNSPLLRAYNPIPNPIIRDMAGRLQMHRGYNPTIGKIAMKRQFLMQFARASESEEEKEQVIESVFAEYAEEMEKLHRESEEARMQAELSQQRSEQALKQSEQSLGQAIKHRNKLSDEVDKIKQNAGDIEKKYVEKIQRDQETIDRLSRELTVTSEELKTEQLARKQSENNLSDTQTKSADTQKQVQELLSGFSKLSDQQKNSQRTIWAIVIAFAYLFSLALFRPWITDRLLWLVFTGLLTVTYIIVLIVWKPLKKGPIGKFFTLFVPLAIIASVALPLGQGKVFWEGLGIVANIGGIVGLFLFLFSGKDS